MEIHLLIPHWLITSLWVLGGIWLALIVFFVWCWFNHFGEG